MSKRSPARECIPCNAIEGVQNWVNMTPAYLLRQVYGLWSLLMASPFCGVWPCNVACATILYPCAMSSTRAATDSCIRSLFSKGRVKSKLVLFMSLCRESSQNWEYSWTETRSRPVSYLTMFYPSGVFVYVRTNSLEVNQPSFRRAIVYA